MRANGERILVVEAEALARQHVKNYLMMLGYLVDDVDRAERAVGLLRSERYDAVVLDAGGEPPDGRLQEIQAVSPGVPVIVMSGTPSIRSIIASLRQGAFDYIIKPYEFSELGTIVPRAVRLGSARSGTSTTAAGATGGMAGRRSVFPAAEF